MSIITSVVSSCPRRCTKRFVEPSAVITLGAVLTALNPPTIYPPNINVIGPVNIIKGLALAFKNNEELLNNGRLKTIATNINRNIISEFDNLAAGLDLTIDQFPHRGFSNGFLLMCASALTMVVMSSLTRNCLASSYNNLPSYCTQPINDLWKALQEALPIEMIDTLWTEITSNQELSAEFEEFGAVFRDTLVSCFVSPIEGAGHGAGSLVLSSPSILANAPSLLSRLFCKGRAKKRDQVKLQTVSEAATAEEAAASGSGSADDGAPVVSADDGKPAAALVGAPLAIKTTRPTINQSKFFL